MRGKHRQWRQRFSAATTAVVAVGLLLAGCATDVVTGEDVTGWVEPAWMSQMRQQQEVFEVNMMGCFSQRGVPSQISFGGGVMTHGEYGPNWLEEAYVRAQAWEECLEIYEFPPLWELPADADTYAMMLDACECVLLHGFEVPEPPALDVWAEQTHPWNPLSYVTHLPAYQLEPLMATCLQVGPGRMSIAPFD